MDGCWGRSARVPYNLFIQAILPGRSSLVLPSARRPAGPPSAVPAKLFTDYHLFNYSRVSPPHTHTPPSPPPQVRTVRRDLQKYEALVVEGGGGPDSREEAGWKLVAGDVFRPPANSASLAVRVRGSLCWAGGFVCWPGRTCGAELGAGSEVAVHVLVGWGKGSGARPVGSSGNARCTRRGAGLRWAHAPASTAGLTAWLTYTCTSGHAHRAPPPPCASLAASLPAWPQVGTGVQILAASLVTLVLAALGFLSPAARGALLTVGILCFVCLAGLAGCGGVSVGGSAERSSTTWLGGGRGGGRGARGRQQGV